MECIPKKDCNYQEKLFSRFYRYFTFCDEEKEKRVKQNVYDLWNFYNIPISEYQCIFDHDVGDDCTYVDYDKPGRPTSPG